MVRSVAVSVRAVMRSVTQETFTDGIPHDFIWKKRECRVVESFLQSWQADCLDHLIQTREYAFYWIYPLGWL